MKRLVATGCWLVGVLVIVSSAAAADPPLVTAAKAGDRQKVSALVRQRADVNAAEVDGTTALHWATRADDLEMMRLLLHSHARATAANRYGITPLALAATNGSSAAIALLLDAGADANTRLTEGETVLMRAARTGRTDAILLLIDRGADVNVAETSLGETALMWAAAENHADAVRVLLKGGATANARSTREARPIRYVSQAGGGTRVPLPRGGWTALMFAARQNAADAVRALAEGGADLNLTDPDGATALVGAIINGHYDLAALLLDKGANPNIGDSQGMAALYAAVDMHTLPPMTDRPPRRVSDTLDSAGLVALLLERGADPNGQLKGATLQRHFNAGNKALGAGTTPFMRAAHGSDLPLMRLLAAKGANPLLTQKNRSTALMLAAGLAFKTKGDDDEGADGGSEQNAIEAMKLCLEFGVDVDAFNDAGQTALHGAVNRGEASIRFLAERGATLDFKDKRGRTALDLATQGSSPAVATLLRDLMKTTGAPTPPRR